MDSDTKFTLVFGGVTVAVVISVCVAMSYHTYLRATYLNSATDPIAAACAFDSGGDKIPPSCMAHMLQPKDPL